MKFSHSRFWFFSIDSISLTKNNYFPTSLEKYSKMQDFCATSVFALLKAFHGLYPKALGHSVQHVSASCWAHWGEAHCFISEQLCRELSHVPQDRLHWSWWKCNQKHKESKPKGYCWHFSFAPVILNSAFTQYILNCQISCYYIIHIIFKSHKHPWALVAFPL